MFSLIPIENAIYCSNIEWALVVPWIFPRFSL
jgi:hypothetical protein